MNEQVINGIYTAESHEKSRVRLLYLPINQSHFELALIITEESKLQSYIFAENYQLIAKDYIEKNPNTKVKFIFDKVSIAGLLPSIDKLIVFVGYVIPSLPKIFNEILSTCLKVRIPVIEIPHGMFQTGINISDDSKLISIQSQFLGIGSALPSISDRKLVWFGNCGFGYPRTVKRHALNERHLPKFTLITSNTNWYLYSHSDKRRFYTEVFQYAKKNPHEFFIWCPHPAELSSEGFSAGALKYRPENIFIYGRNNDIYFHDLDGANDLIPHCDYAISTISTCLLDYEIFDKRVNIFTCIGTQKLMNILSQKSIFNSHKEITPNASYLRTGLLKDFNSEHYDNLISEEIHIENNFKYQFITSFFSC
ncbi:hypothetical protein [Pantoea sp. SM3]|uniref:hypothetical protein n=1 Tax=Pantoea sp. SM3 TaxID=1628192 RepID=UPI0005F7F7BD|nr:hypothetical protein [Pantoea sp. SM3]KJV31158.1 hypothetical protein VI01_11710 [Pantoea sp. SM3]